MKRIILLTILLITLICQSGCVLGFAALVRWDHMRWKKMQAEKQEKENSEKSKIDIDK